MILTKENQCIDTENGKIFPSDTVKVNKIGYPYTGLIGTVVEIRTEEDKLTDNDTIDVICSFSYPDTCKGKKEFEKQYSDYAGSPYMFEVPNNKTNEINWLNIDSVVMSPEMLDVIPSEKYEVTSYAVITQTSPNFPFKIKQENKGFGKRTSAERYFSNLFTKSYTSILVEEDQITVNSFTDWVSNANVSFSDCYFSAADDKGNFIVSTIEVIENYFGSEISSLVSDYDKANYLEDIMNKAKEKLENDEISENEFDYICENANPYSFSRDLSKNDGYFESFWYSVDDYLDELLCEYDDSEDDEEE